MAEPRSPVDATLVEAACALVDLELEPERRASLAALFNAMVRPACESLNQVDVDELPPAHSFDSRWGRHG
ncbi:MAG TPA: hypothetical protein VFQ88_06385 [Nevskiaceae bacterium]|nr:hypothetical protein [Nevskiaceae bacterium]